MQNAPESTQQGMCRPRRGWYFVRDRLNVIFLPCKVWQEAARYIPSSHDDETDKGDHLAANYVHLLNIQRICERLMQLGEWLKRYVR